MEKKNALSELHLSLSLLLTNDLGKFLKWESVQLNLRKYLFFLGGNCLMGMEKSWEVAFRWGSLKMLPLGYSRTCCFTKGAIGPMLNTDWSPEICAEIYEISRRLVFSFFPFSSLALSSGSSICLPLHMISTDTKHMRIYCYHQRFSLRLEAWIMYLYPAYIPSSFPT